MFGIVIAHYSATNRKAIAVNTSIIEIVILDDHRVTAEGIRLLLTQDPFIKVKETFCNADVFLSTLSTLHFDILLLDYFLIEKSVDEVVVEVQKHLPYSKILVLTGSCDPMIASKTKALGVAGCMTKNCSRHDLCGAIKDISNGGKTFPEHLPEITSSGIPDTLTGVSIREKEILSLIALEMTNQQIANKLFLSLRTVETHRKNLLRKLAVKNTAGLVRLAFQNGLIK